MAVIGPADDDGPQFYCRPVTAKCAAALTGERHTPAGKVSES